MFWRNSFVPKVHSTKVELKGKSWNMVCHNQNLGLAQYFLEEKEKNADNITQDKINGCLKNLYNFIKSCFSFALLR